MSWKQFARGCCHRIIAMVTPAYQGVWKHPRHQSPLLTSTHSFGRVDLPILALTKMVSGWRVLYLRCDTPVLLLYVITWYLSVRDFLFQAAVLTHMAHSWCWSSGLHEGFGRCPEEVQASGRAGMVRLCPTAGRNSWIHAWLGDNTACCLPKYKSSWHAKWKPNTPGVTCKNIFI